MLNQPLVNLPQCSCLASSRYFEAARHRDRQGETLFIDARNIGSMIDRTHKELSAEDIGGIAETYHAWRRQSDELGVMSDELKKAETHHSSLLTQHSYADQPGYCKSATLAEIRGNDFVLTPGRYVGAAPIEDDGIPFEADRSENGVC